MNKNKVIGNVNILDLRNATEASIAEIERIENANLVIYTQGKADMLAKIEVRNANAMMDIPPSTNVQRILGQTTINRDYFKNLDEPVFLIVAGQVIIEPDVPPEEIQAGLAGSFVMGQMICPDPIAGLFQTTNSQVLGQIKIYPAMEHVQIGSFALDPTSLNALEDGTELAVVGSLSIPDVLPNDLLETKLRKLFVSRPFMCPEENAHIIQNKLVLGSGEMTIIPKGFKLVDHALKLDANLVENLPASKLYCTERVLIEADVEPGMLDKNIEGLISQEIIVCPSHIKEILVKKCDLLENDVLFYDGYLWHVDDEQHLRVERLKFMESDTTLLVTGELTIDPQVTPDALAEHLLKVHNLGLIRCTPQQMGFIESRLGKSDGELLDITQEADDESSDYWMENVNYLAL